MFFLYKSCHELNDALGRQRQRQMDLRKFEAILVYKASSRTARIVTQRKGKKEKKKRVAMVMVSPHNNRNSK